MRLKAWVAFLNSFGAAPLFRKKIKCWVGLANIAMIDPKAHKQLQWDNEFPCLRHCFPKNLENREPCNSLQGFMDTNDLFLHPTSKKYLAD